MSIGPVSRFLTAGGVGMLYPAVTVEVLQGGVMEGSLHPVYEVGSGQSYYRGEELVKYLLKLGLITQNALETGLSAFEYQ